MLRQEQIPAKDRLWAVLRPTVLDDRTLRLLACAYVRRTPLGDGRMVWDLLTDERSIAAVVVAERHARGEATDEEQDAARDAAWAAAKDAAWAAAKDAAKDAAWDAAKDAAWDAARDAAWDAAWAAARDARAAKAAAGDAAWDAQVAITIEMLEADHAQD
jgi:hypothetical protein